MLDKVFSDSVPPYRARGTAALMASQVTSTWACVLRNFRFRSIRAIAYLLSRASFKLAQVGIRWAGAIDHIDTRVPGRNAQSIFRRPSPVTGQLSETGAKGFNVIKFADDTFGLGRSASSYIRMLERAGYALAVQEISFDATSKISVHEAVWPSFDTTLVFVNPDHFLDVVAAFPGLTSAAHRLIGCWFWELEQVPPSWAQVARHVDGIMVATEFVEKAFRSIDGAPVFRVPVPMEETVRNVSVDTHQPFFTVLTAFDFFSGFNRKNPLAAYKAFAEAFPADADVKARLVIKTNNAAFFPAEFRSLMRCVASDWRVRVVNGAMSANDLDQLQEAADAFISLHRSEGFGMSLAEMIMKAKPVVATGWSGNLDFMREDSTYLVDFDLVPVAQGGYRHAGPSRWAEPRVKAAAEMLRRIANDPVTARLRSADAYSYMMAKLSFESCAKQFEQGMSRVTVRSKRQLL